MKNNMKKRLAIFLSIMLILPTIMQVLPMASTEVSAASTYTYLNSGIWSSPVVLEQGTKMEWGNYVSVMTEKNGKYTYASGKDVKAKYKSSDASVATISNKGLITAKKVGTATITVTYKGKILSTNFEIVAKGSINKPAAATTLKKKANAIKKGTPKTVTSSNIMKCLKLMNAYDAVVDQNWDVISDNGCLREKVTINYGNGYTSTYTTTTGKIAVPEAAYYRVLQNKINNYTSKCNPTSTRSSKTLKVKSVSANTKAITVKFKKKVDTDQIMAAKATDYSFGSKESSSKTKAYAYVRVCESATGKVLNGKMELKKGKNTAKITIQEWDSTARKYVDKKLTAGSTYELGYKSDWINKKVTVK